MRFMHTNYAGKVSGPYTAEEAVMRQGEAEAALCDGELERVRAQLRTLQCTVGRLIDALPLTGRAGTQALCDVLGQSWGPEK